MIALEAIFSRENVSAQSKSIVSCDYHTQVLIFIDRAGKP